MATHTNFYESLPEAQMRLRGSIILYDGLPYYVWAVTDHMGDGAFRVYMSEIEKVSSVPGSNPVSYGHPPHTPNLGQMMDEWMEQNKGHMIRKKMNSPLFNKFRPFPLGMMNQDTNAIYVSRQPARPKTEQGLTPQMLFTVKTTLGLKPAGNHVDVYSESFRDCILGNYPAPKTVLDGLKNPKYVNESVAFHREFALVRGPIDLIFLAYREDIIGVLPNADFSRVKIGKEFPHTREVTEELNLFATVM